jgi:PAS domain S-box-containing protein
LRAGIFPLSVIPVIIIGLFFGLKGGFLVGLLIGLIDIFLLNSIIGLQWENIIRSGTVSGFIAIIVIGCLIGIVGDLSKRLKNKQEKLKKSEEMYRFLFDNIQDGVFVVEKGKIKFVNKALIEKTGYEINEIIGHPFYKIVAPEDQEKVIRRYYQRVKGVNVPKNYEISVLHKDGKTKILFDVNIKVVEVESQKITIGTLRDITERKRREKELKILYEVSSLLNKSLNVDQILERLVEAIGKVINYHYCSICLIDKKKNALVTKVTRGIGKDYWKYREIIPFEKNNYDISELTALKGKPFYIHNLMNIDIPKEIKENIIKKYNLRSHLSIPIKVNQEVVGVLNIMTQEIRKFTSNEIKLLLTLAEHAGLAIMKAHYFNLLRESEKKYRSLFERSKDVIFVISPNGEIIDINPAGVELFGYSSKEEIMKINAKSLFYYIEDWNKYQKLMEKRNEIKNYEFILKDKEGNRIIGHISSNVLKDEKDNIIAYEGIIRDYTDQKELENQLIQSQKLESLGRLTAGIAHDFNNILTTLMGYADLIKMTSSNSPQIKEKLEIIISQCQHASTLIRQLLDFSRSSITEKFPVDILPHLKETVKLLNRTIPENINIEFNYKQDEYKVKANINQLQQVITNLAINSYDAMPKGGTLKIDIWKEYFDILKKPFPEMKDGEWVVLKLKDTGVGIPKEILPRIFEPFFTTKPPGKGTGLGLSQTYGIIKQHNGYIKVESEVGKGTIFTIYLPIYKSPKEMEIERKEEKKLINGRGEKILIVEDDESILELMKRTLKKLKYKAITASNGKEGIYIYEKYKNEIKLVISDRIMPELSGIELIKSLRKKNPELKILIITGYPLRENEINFLKKNKISWIQKPFNVQQFSKIVRETLENTS